MTRISKLRKKIDIQRSTSTQNSFGEDVKTWVDFAINRWARVETLSGKEFFQAQRIVGEVDTRFTIRFIPRVKEKMRVIYGGNPYDIQSALPDERNKELELLCKRIST